MVSPRVFASPLLRGGQRRWMRAAAVLSLALVAGAPSLAGRQPPAPPTRSHHPDIPYQSPVSLGAAL